MITRVGCHDIFEAVYKNLLTELGVILLEHFAELNPLFPGIVDAVETELASVKLGKSSGGINLYVDVSVAA